MRPPRELERGCRDATACQHPPSSTARAPSRACTVTQGVSMPIQTVPLVSLCPEYTWQAVPGRTARVGGGERKMGDGRHSSKAVGLSAAWQRARGSGEGGQLDCDRSVERDDLPMLGKGEREDAARVRGTRARAQRSTPSRPRETRLRDASACQVLTLSPSAPALKLTRCCVKLRATLVHSHPADRIATLDPRTHPSLHPRRQRSTRLRMPRPPSPLSALPVPTCRRHTIHASVACQGRVLAWLLPLPELNTRAAPPCCKSRDH